MTGGRHLVPALAAPLLGVAMMVTSCSAQAPTAADAPDAELRVEILRTLDHDPNAFTQGLEIAGDDLFEGTGRSGESWVRATNLGSGTVRARAELPPPLFGEGITVVDDTVWQLTWRDGVAIARDRETLSEQRRVALDAEGWGICALAGSLVTSDGSSTLTFRDSRTFEAQRTVQARRDGVAVAHLNELECADDGTVYANVWTTDTLVRIDPADGGVIAAIDASALRDALPPGPRDVDVLNGVAQIPGTDRFLLTGKYWPRMFEVRFVP
ncbi:glutaminyl-peptide cyclotransferase [Rhodococcus oxybenzonivorans]|uniref:Glutaminyl-peptide cyclotransferase n=1 Tax=Rhodococcus oxybenzonivorans TaxID=1990687 RepID=A0A2S2BRQ5_9NOCA|nr:glutaminyl-peptide cyclotransferase [Rhodococcus oxybenzonivorans]AWK71273.1 glutaminyl-peptide cyclotransferase [Rhodococcus oxybenzonivorans]